MSTYAYNTRVPRTEIINAGFSITAHEAYEYNISWKRIIINPLLFYVSKIILRVTINRLVQTHPV